MWKLIKAQCNVILNKKEFAITFIIMLTCVITNHLYNIYTYHGKEVVDLMAFPEISLLGSNNTASYFFLKIYPFLLVIPSGFSLAQDRNSSIELLWIQRCGKQLYYISKLLSVFLMTFFCFFIPFLFEIFLNIISFPANIHGTLFGYGVYTTNYEFICEYPLFELYYDMPAIYSFLMSLYFSVVTAILAMLPSAISCIFSKYKAYLLIPVYLLIYVLNIFGVWGTAVTSGNKVTFSMSVSWCNFMIHDQQFIRILLVSSVIFIVSLFIYSYKARKDTL